MTGGTHWKQRDPGCRAVAQVSEEGKAVGGPDSGGAGGLRWMAWELDRKAKSQGRQAESLGMVTRRLIQMGCCTL